MPIGFARERAGGVDDGGIAGTSVQTDPGGAEGGSGENSDPGASVGSHPVGSPTTTA